VSTKASRVTKTRVDTITLTPEIVNGWKSPPFQRPLNVNEKVRALVERLKQNAGVLPDILTIGILGKDEFLLDGQHRCKAFLLAEVEEGYTDIRYWTFESMADMGDAFVELNGRLANLRPDDILRALEGTNDALRLLRKRCNFVGYDMIRRGTSSPILGMSLLLRSWLISKTETPSPGGSASATSVARELSTEESGHCADFLLLAEKAWGRDPEYARLWGNVNLTLCMWIYRRMVLSQGIVSGSRLQHMTAEQFRNCLMSLSADSHFLDWLVGRKLSDRDRSPAYARIKIIFQKRLHQDTNKRWLLPAPEWASHQSSRGSQ